MSFASMLQGLTRARVRFVVVGGVAAAAHGSAQVTNDLEICYDTAPDNIARLAALLAEWDAYPGASIGGCRSSWMNVNSERRRS